EPAHHALYSGLPQGRRGTGLVRPAVGKFLDQSAGPGASDARVGGAGWSSFPGASRLAGEGFDLRERLAFGPLGGGGGSHLLAEEQARKQYLERMFSSPHGADDP